MKQENNSIHVACLNVAQISDAEFQTISAKVRTWNPLPETTTITDSVLRKHVLGKWLTFSLLSMYGITPENMKNIARSQYGKPFLPGAPVSFNISHSDSLIVGVATLYGEIGVDVEHIRPVDWKQYEDCFSINEWRTISFTDDPHRKLLEAWTKKESLVKADGRGLQITLTDVILNEERGIIAGEKKNWHIREIPIQGYMAHVCAEFPVKNIQMLSQRESIVAFDSILSV